MTTQPAIPLDVFACPLQGANLIEASAGTGKTWAICGLYLRLVLERGLEVQKILVVTFTIAATAELRERIRERMVQVLARLQGRGPAGDVFTDKLLDSLRSRHALSDADMIKRLEAAVQNFDEAAIFTIHGFAKRALDDAPFAAGMPLSQELLADDRELLAATASDFWRRHVAAPGLSPALAAYLMAQKDSPERFARLLRRQAGKPLSRVIWPAGTEGDAAPIDTTRLQAAHDAASAIWQSGREDVIACVAEGLPRLKANIHNAASVAKAFASWDQLLATANAMSAPANLEKLDLLTPARMVPKKGQQPCAAHPFFDAAAALLVERDALDRQLAQARIRLLRRLLEEGPVQLRQAKRERRVVGFDDMLYNLHERLTGERGPALTETLRQRFPAALIDEFQDTDPLQSSIFDTLYGNGESLLFLVGDPKQAIYSFRNADLHTYLQARRIAQAEYTLAHNQRSTPQVLQALNALFGGNPRAFMLDGLQYRPVDAGDKPRPVLADRSATSAALQLWTLPPQADGRRPAKSQARREATHACAAEIARLLAAGQSGEVTLDGRPLAAGDIAVLVRTHSQGSQMRHALEALGVGSVELSQASVFKTPDAQDLERVLAAILEPSREGLLRAALSTELMGLDASAIEALAGDEASILARLADFAGYRDRWLKGGLARMLRGLFAQEQVSRRMLARTDGERRLTNLRHLAECLHEASQEHGTPEALLRWLRQQRAQDIAEDATQLRLESDRNLVQIVTIHKSKGLEYPIVFCPFLWDGHPGPAGDLMGLEYHDDDGKPVIDFSGDDDPAVKQKMALERAAENLRLIYVALTRAVHRCYLVVGSYTVGQYSSTKECTRGPINWLAAGREHGPNQWLANGLDAGQVDAAWTRLAQENAPAIAIAELPQGSSVRVILPSPSPEKLAAREPPLFIPPAWRIGSYSSLAHGARSENAAADHDVRVPREADLSPASVDGWGGGTPRASRDRALAILPADDILRFPRGARAGECLHAVFEQVDFADPTHWPQAIANVLRTQPPQAATVDSAAWPAMVQRMLADVTATPLPGAHSLSDISRGNRLVELEFSLPSAGLDAGQLAATLRRHGYEGGALGFARLQGYLRGFIDLVYQHEGRFHVLDWKSNHLGWSAADYGAGPLRRAMDEQGYHLQYLLYTVALHRYLRQRLRGYDYDQHFGGVNYVFLRGVRPAWKQADGSAAGVFFHKPQRDAVEALDFLLGQGEGGRA
jgi:exodeoxyribonuclease V beta subunit